MEMFLLFWYCCACMRLVQNAKAKNIAAILNHRDDYEGVDVTRQIGYVGELRTHKVIDPNDAFTGVSLSTSDSKLENIAPTQVIQVYRFLGDHLAFKLLNGEYVEQYQDPCQKYLYYEVVDGVIEMYGPSCYYKMIVPFYNPCKYIELSGPSCHFNKSITDSGVVVYDIVGTIYVAEIRAHSKLVYYNRGSSAKRIVKILNYRIHYIPFIDIQFETPNDTIFTMTFLTYMGAWLSFGELKERLNLVYQSIGRVVSESASRSIVKSDEQYGRLLQPAVSLIVSPIKITVDLESETESALVTIENYKDEYGEINIYICNTVCAFEEAFFEGSRIFSAEEHPPFMISLQQGFQHNVAYALALKPGNLELREYVQIGDKWLPQTMSAPTRYFYLLVLDPNKTPDRRLYTRECVKGRIIAHTFVARNLIGFSAVLVEENGTIIKRYVENVIFTTVTIRNTCRLYVYYEGDTRMMILDNYVPGYGWNHGTKPILVGE